MIVGIGHDIIEINRVRKACEKEAFLTCCFTEEEISQSGNNYSRLAGNFATKEAVVKAFGTGFRNIALKDIEVLRNDAGAPYVKLYNNALAKFEALGGSSIFVTISNLKDLASSVVIIERKD